MKALQLERSVSRFAAARIGSGIHPRAAARVGPLRLARPDPPPLPGPGWVRVRPRLAGICGSDLATIQGRASRYFEPLVSFPFVPGHEVVGELDDGARVVVEPVLGCVSRGIDPPCPACAGGDLGGCENVAFGDLEPGLQSGFCADTGGGWSVAMVAHASQVHPVPDAMDDEEAVMVEPAACAIHGVLAAAISSDDVVAVLGSGTVGLLTVGALRRYHATPTIVATAKYAGQRAWARQLGADVVVAPSEVERTVRRMTSSKAVGPPSAPRLTGGADVVLDCVGTSETLATALSVVRPRGTVVLLGMPGVTTVDLTGLWHREVRLIGSYAYGLERVVHPDDPTEPAVGERPPPEEPRRTFDLAFELVRDLDLGRLVTATYPLDRHADAIGHALAAGDRGAVKVAFDLRGEKERNRL